MKIVVVLGNYYPNYSAVGICAKNIVDVLIKRGHEVWVLCGKSSSNAQDLTLDGAKVRYYTTAERERRRRRQGWGSYLLRAYYFCKILFSHFSLKKELIEAIEEGLNDIANKELEGKAPDVVVDMVFPFESVIGTLSWINKTKKATEVIPVMFDNFVENPNLHRTYINYRIKRNRHIRLMRDAISCSSRVLVMHNQKDFYVRYNLNDSKKIVFVEHPLLVPPIILGGPVSFNKEQVLLLYSGALLKNYVVGNDLCQMISELIQQDSRIKAEFCVMGNDTQGVVELGKRYPDNVKNNGKVPMDVTFEKMAYADVLLCVAEKKGIQISSKIFTYMSYGKPIILIYYCDGDVNKAILQKYPLFMPVRASELYEEIPSILSFIINNWKSRLPFSKVASIYPEALPESICDYILKEK